MRIYVAAKWEDKANAALLMNQLREAGHTITYDWTTCSVCDEEQALRDMEAVLDADAFVGIFVKDLPYLGSVAEFGMAAICGMPCYLIGHAIDACIFTKLPNVHYGLELLDS